MTAKIVECALFYNLKNHLEGKESYWLSVKAINENIGTDSEAYRNLDTKEINKRKLFSKTILSVKVNSCGAPSNRITSFLPSFYGDRPALAKPHWSKLLQIPPKVISKPSPRFWRPKLICESLLKKPSSTGIYTTRS